MGRERKFSIVEQTVYQLGKWIDIQFVVYDITNIDMFEERLKDSKRLLKLQKKNGK